MTSSTSLLSAEPQTLAGRVAGPARHRSHLAVWAGSDSVGDTQPFEIYASEDRDAVLEIQVITVAENARSGDPEKSLLAILFLHFSSLVFPQLHLRVHFSSTEIPLSFSTRLLSPTQPSTPSSAPLLNFHPAPSFFSSSPGAAHLPHFCPAGLELGFFDVCSISFFPSSIFLCDCKHKAHNCSLWPHDLLVIAITMLAGFLMSLHSSFCPRSLQIQIREGEWGKESNCCFTAHGKKRLLYFLYSLFWYHCLTSSFLLPVHFMCFCICKVSDFGRIWLIYSAYQCSYWWLLKPWTRYKIFEILRFLRSFCPTQSQLQSFKHVWICHAKWLPTCRRWCQEMEGHTHAHTPEYIFLIINCTIFRSLAGHATYILKWHVSKKY